MIAAPRGPFDRARWTSPLRGPWMASVLSVFLLVLFAIDLATGYLSYASYQPQLGANGLTGGGLDRHLFGWTWPTDPVWLHAVVQGSHVVAGIVAMPIVAAKLWTVIPKLYEWPPARSPAHALERLMVALLVGSTIFLLLTGLWDIGYWYQAFGPFGLPHFSFVKAHYYAAYVFCGALGGHVLIKGPTLVRALRARGLVAPLREDLAHTIAEAAAEGTSAPTAPAAATVSRRGFLGAVGAASLVLGLSILGETVGGPLRRTALLAPRGREPGNGPNGFPINKTAAGQGIDRRDLMAPRYRLEVRGARRMTLTRAQLEALPQHTYELPISCVEGWVTTQTWTGVRLRDLARMAGVARPASAHLESVETGGEFRQATLSAIQTADDRALLALKVNGADLSVDHGYPARAIVPDAPGVHNTKWVARITFAERA
jgi:DMSO/TMAO reductase YedYZ molybdopterin-dependent catalytic subunit